MNKAILRTSERVYAFLLKLYPESYRGEFGAEMEYIFSESFKEAYSEHGDQGIIALWGRTILDTGKSLVIQHIEDQKGSVSMKTKNTDILMQNKVFVWIGVATVLILLIPMVAMQFTNEVNWSLLDFTTMGVLLFGTGSIFVMTARQVRNHTYRVVIGIALALVLFYVWAELAVGIFTTWGS